MKNFISDDLIMSFWGYERFKEQNIRETVNMWKDAGFNIVLSYIYTQEDNCPEKMLEMLDECEKKQLKVILYDDRIHCHRLMEISEEEYIKRVEKSVEEFGKHKAVAGYFVSDEPNKDALKFARKAVEIVDAHSPVPAFVSFYPMWRSSDYVDLMGVEGGDIEKIYLPFKDSGMKCLSYDCYACMDIREQEKGLNGYFDNLNTFYKVAKQAGIPLWTSVLCTGHWTYKQPDLSDMRWEVATSLAHGVKGILWFMLYDNADCMGDSPIDIYGEKQPSYYDMRKVNKEFLRLYGKIIPELELEQVYHYNNAYGKTVKFEHGVDLYMIHFEAKHKDNAIISRFKHRETGNVWYMIVNSSMLGGNTFNFKFCDKFNYLDGNSTLDKGRLCLIELKGENDAV